jgi:arylformamidase
MTNTEFHTADWYERQYNPRVTVANAVAIIPAWRKRAIATRESHPPLGDMKYGPHPRENLDLFRVRNAKGTVVYIHGGYWRMLSKLETSWIADGFLQQGLNVALINYPLCPDVTVAHIRQSCIRAFAYLWKNVLEETERQKIVVTGHSAGGHLAAHHLTVDWRTHNLPENPIVGVLPVSGIFNVEPLVHTSMNADIGLTPESTASLNLMNAKLCCNSQLVFAVGADEPSEFHRQSHDQAKAWAILHPRVLGLPDKNHFTVIDSLADPQGSLNREIINMLAI